MRVLDFGRVLAAPYGTMHLADLGADVVKVGNPGRGRHRHKPARPRCREHVLPERESRETNILDLKDPGHRDLARRLALAADGNYRPGVMARLGLDAASLRAEKPGLVYATIRGFADPEDLGLDTMMQGLSGIPSITGPVDGPPSSVAPALRTCRRMHLVQGILAALFRQERTGLGAHIVVPLCRCPDGLLSTTPARG